MGRRIVHSLGKATSTWARSWEEDIEVTSRIKNPHQRRKWLHPPLCLCNRSLGLEDILWHPALSGEVLDVSIDWGDWSDGGSGGSGRR